MISKEAKDLYRSIHAPDNLKERVLSQTRKPSRKNKVWKTILPAAACFAVTFVLFLQFLQPPTEVSLQGTVVGAEPIAIEASAVMAARSLPVQPMQITLEIPKNSVASVSHGTVETSERNLVWTILPAMLDDGSAVLTLQQKDEQAKYLLYTNDTGIWYLVKEET